MLQGPVLVFGLCSPPCFLVFPDLTLGRVFISCLVGGLLFWVHCQVPLGEIQVI